MALAGTLGAGVLLVRDDRAQRGAFEANLRSVVLAMINDFHHISLIRTAYAGVEIAERLQAFGDIRRLYVRDSNGDLTFSYARPGLPPSAPPVHPAIGEYQHGSIWLEIPLVVRDAEMGRALLQGDLEQFQAVRAGRVKRMGAAVAILFGATSIVALAFGGAVMRPLMRITAFVSESSLTLDTRRRLDESHGGEIGQLTAAINRFLEALQRRQDAESASRAKSEFLASMSHEIRTPLTAILGYADLMLLPNQTADEKIGCIHVIRHSGEHLLDVINEILDLSKIEAGKMSVESISCSPIEVVEEVRSFMQVRAAERGVRLDVNYRFPLPARVETDPFRLRQILTNLVANAVKFSKSRVDISVTLDADASGDRVRCDVADDGIGMTAKQIEQLFQPFAQAEASTSRRYGGSGLGLTIAQRLAALLGGVIEVTSSPGHGSTFTLSFPVGRDHAGLLMEAPPLAGTAAAAPPVHSEEQQLAGIHVLVAEDNPVNQHLVRRLLERAGARVETVENGRLAVQRTVEMNAADTGFHIVLMDIQMPVMDGYRATAELRRHGYQGAIVALTAHAMSGDRERCLSAGCDGYLSKPIRRDCLYEIVRLHGQRRETGGPGTMGIRATGVAASRPPLIGVASE